MVTTFSILQSVDKRLEVRLSKRRFGDLGVKLYWADATKGSHVGMKKAEPFQVNLQDPEWK